VATVYLALGVAGWIAVSRASWRVPVLGILTIQYVLHPINHANASSQISLRYT
jgi:hypothetical protein